MFYLYRSNPGTSAVHYEKIQPVSLFGCRNGLIAKALSTLLPVDANEPCQWHLCARHLAEGAGLAGNEIVIDADPNNQDAIWLYRLRGVYGHSESDWTPMLWHCDGITDGESSRVISKRANGPTANTSA